MEQERSLQEKNGKVIGDGDRLLLNFGPDFSSNKEDFALIELDKDVFSQKRASNADQNEVMYITPNDPLKKLFGMRCNIGDIVEYETEAGEQQVRIEEIEVRKSV